MASPFTLAHLSDPHLPPPPRAVARGIKPRLARAAWGRKRRQHRSDVLAAILADIAVHAPDHVVVTGDLVNFAAPAEFVEARAWLEALADPRNLTVVPGNHDALVPSAGAGRACWAPWMEDAPGPHPKLRVRGGVALIGVDSATPTPPGSARGRVGAAQRERLEAMLVQAGADGLARVVMLHHAPAPGEAPWRKALADAPDLAETLRRAGAELVLHGHLHRGGLTALAGPRGAIPVLGAPSASSAGSGDRAARWHLITLSPTADGAEAKVDVRGRGRDGTIGAVGGYRLRLGARTDVAMASA